MLYLSEKCLYNQSFSRGNPHGRCRGNKVLPLKALPAGGVAQWYSMCMRPWFHSLQCKTKMRALPLCKLTLLCDEEVLHWPVAHLIYLLHKKDSMRSMYGTEWCLRSKKQSSGCHWQKRNSKVDFQASIACVTKVLILLRAAIICGTMGPVLRCFIYFISNSHNTCGKYLVSLAILVHFLLL